VGVTGSWLKEKQKMCHDCQKRLAQINSLSCQLK